MTHNPSLPGGILPCLIVRGGTQAIDFYRRAFGAELMFDLPMPDGRVGHAEMSIGIHRFALADEFPELNFVSPVALNGTPVTLSVYVDDVDAMASRALDAGATLERPVRNEFYGDRVAQLRDPFGHRWSFQTRIEEVSPDEMRRRMSAGADG